MIKKVVKSEFGRNVVTLMTGAGLAQLIPLLLTPVLTRMFSPEEFGLYTFYMSLITFFLVVSSGRYEQAIVLPKEDKDAINILGLSFLILVGFTILLFSILFLCYTQIAGVLNEPELVNWLWLLPVCVFFASTYRIFTLWSNRKKRFVGTSVALFSQTVTRALVQFTGGLLKFKSTIFTIGFAGFLKTIFKRDYVTPNGTTVIGIGALILSYLFGFVLGTFWLLVPFIKKDRSLLQFISKEQMAFQAKLHQKFPKINSLHALGDEFKNIGVNATILYAFSEVILGFYSMTFRILRAPLSVIGNSFAQVFYQKAAEMHANNQSYLNLINKTVKKLSLIALPIFAVILFFGPGLFAFVLGEEWRVAGEYTQYLIPWLFLQFVISPIQQVAVIANKQGQIFLISLVGNIIILGSILIGGFVFGNIKYGFLLLSAFQVFYYLYVYLWVVAVAKKSISNFQV